MKAPRLLENTIDEFLWDAMALQVEEADSPADLSQLAGDRLATSLPDAQVWRDVEGRYFFVRVRMVHQVDGFVIIPDVAPHIMGFRVMRFQLLHDYAPHVYAVGASGRGGKRPVPMLITLACKPILVNDFVILSDNVQCARIALVRWPCAAECGRARRNISWR